MARGIGLLGQTVADSEPITPAFDDLAVMTPQGTA